MTVRPCLRITGNPLRRLAGSVAIVIVAVAVGLGISVALHHRQSGGPAGDGGVGGGTSVPGTGASPTVPVDIVPGAGQTLLNGTLTSLHADNAVGPPLAPPFTITIPVRGAGSADLTGVSVGGRDVEIYWYGGQPLPVSGTGRLAVDGGGVIVDGSGTTWSLDGAARSLSAGQFHLGAPVAVGSGGLATPYQNITFAAGDRSTVQTTGRAQVHLAPAPLHLDGPGSVTLHGDFQVQTSAGTRHVPSAVFGPGSYSIDLVPVSGGDTIKATLQGPVTFG
jgi:hypothetical protein